MVGCTPLFKDENCLWMIEILNPYQKLTNQEVWFGDIVGFKHVITGAYLALSTEYKS